MEPEKQTYYVNMTSETIMPEPADNPSFTIHATPKEVELLQSAFEKNHDKDIVTWIRAHIPTFEYFDDPKNKEYDSTMKIIYAIIYSLGDQQARDHIESMGILSTNKSEDPTYIKEEDR